MQKYSVIIIGSGAAGYGTADWLSKHGIKNIAVLTENKNFGTSRNAGSDKQTYYKISFTEQDSAEKMAKELACGGGMHYDTALIEAVNSTRCFMKMVEYGVPFPTDKLGRFIGYKTDHDAASRGTSAGPLTSKFMTQCLEKNVEADGNIRIIDGAAVIKIVKQNNKAVGVIYLSKTDDSYELVPVFADYVVIATGGAAGVYKFSAYPYSQTGAMGLAIEAGCKLNNLTEWQYGIASTKVRWNLSGSYQQVIPAYYSVDKNGEKHEFLSEYFNSISEALNNVFLKGYQWPFDSKKVNGSSAVDLAVSSEIKKGRKVFMDFRENPQGYSLDNLSDEAKQYLINANAQNGKTPFKRLAILNPKAIEFYKCKGIDLNNEPLEIAVCAQHMNGGIDVDCNWQTSVKNLFAVGEAAGTFGMYRPGGSALNSTQVGGLRVAEYISNCYENNNCDETFFENQIKAEYDYIKNCFSDKAVEKIDFSSDMSKFAAHCRIYEEIDKLNRKIKKQLSLRFFKIKENSFGEIFKLYKYKDNLEMQSVLCGAMLSALHIVGARGGAVFYKDNKIVPENIVYREKAVVTLDGKTTFEKLRNTPNTEYNFEQEWQRFYKRRDLSGG